MTRINCVPVEELHNKHLLAEYRELPRIFKQARPYTKRDNVPNQYKMGAGHVLFFYDKLLWLYKRQTELVKELLSRDFKITFVNTQELLEASPFEHLYNDWTPTEEAMEINRQRIRERLIAMGELDNEYDSM